MKSDFSKPWIALLILFPIFLACRKDVPIPVTPCDPCDTIKPWVWIHQFDTLYGEDFLAVDPVMYEGNPIYVLHDAWDCRFGSAQRVTCIDAETGIKLWGFDLPDTCGILNNAYIYGDVLLINSGHRVQGYDLRTRQLAWEFPIQKPRIGSVGLTGIRDKAYLCVEYNSVPDFQASGILEIDMLTGNYREICHVSKEEVQGYPSFNPPTLWENAAGDSSFLFLTMGRYHYSLHPDKETYALLAYDRNKDELIWVADSIGIPTNNYRSVEIYENKVLLPVGANVELVAEGREACRLAALPEDQPLAEFGLPVLQLAPDVAVGEPQFARCGRDRAAVLDGLQHVHHGVAQR